MSVQVPVVLPQIQGLSLILPKITGRNNLCTFEREASSAQLFVKFMLKPIRLEACCQEFMSRSSSCHKQQWLTIVYSDFQLL
jgi:hypothetical protein